MVLGIGNAEELKVWGDTMNWRPPSTRWLVVSVAMLLLTTSSRIGPLKTVLKPNVPWTGKSLPGVYLERGSYGLEVSPDFYWIKDEVIRLRIENPTDSPLSASVRFAVGPTPCGVIPRVSFTTQTSANFETNHIQEWPIVFVRPKRHEAVTVKLQGEYCKIDSDPRKFLGSISGFELKDPADR